MRTFRRLLVFILFTFAFMGTMSINFASVKAVEYAAVWSEDFEDLDTTQSYNTSQTYPDANIEFYYGTVSTDSCITGTKSGHMRWYSSAKTNYPYFEYTFASVTNVDKIDFNYAAGNVNVHFTVEYSTDGENYTVLTNVVPTKGTKTTYSNILASTISVLKFRIRVNNTGTAPTSGNYKFRIDDIVLSTESSAPQLSAPTNASISGNVLSFNAVANAVSYNVGFYASESAANPTKVVNINSTSYTFTQQSTDGNNYIKVQAVGNGVNYTSSNYSYVGTYTYIDIPVKTIAQADALPIENAAPYSYYEISGYVSRIISAGTSNLYISDGERELYIFNLKAEKGGSSVSTSALGIEEGFDIRIRAYKTIHNTTVELVGYLVSVVPNYTNQFVALNTVASLKVNYTSNMDTAPANSQAIVDLPDSEITAASNISYSTNLGLNPSIFKVTFEKNNGSTAIAIRNDNIRLYPDNTNGNGGALTIEGVSGVTIRKIVITYDAEKYGGATISGICDFDDSNVGLTYTYFFNSATPYVTIKNEKTDGNHIRLNSITIYYSGSYASSYTINTETVAAVEKPIVSLMFGGILSSTLKDNLDSTGTTVTYGVVYAKTSTLTALAKSLGEALEAGDDGIYTVAGTPVKVNSDGTENPEGSYYQVGVALNHISESNYNTEITAATYVCIDGTYSLMNEKAYSVKSIASAYSSADCTSYSEHLGVLGYLATYGD